MIKIWYVPKGMTCAFRMKWTKTSHFLFNGFFYWLRISKTAPIQQVITLTLYCFILQQIVKFDGSGSVFNIQRGLLYPPEIEKWIFNAKLESVDVFLQLSITLGCRRTWGWYLHGLRITLHYRAKPAEVRAYDPQCLVLCRAVTRSSKKERVCSPGILGIIELCSSYFREKELRSRSRCIGQKGAALPHPLLFWKCRALRCCSC